jgi:hypothetical protein
MLSALTRIATFAACLLLVSCGSGGGDGNTTSVAAPAVPAATAPGAPTSITVTAADAAVTLTFSAPASDGGASISGYTATCSAGTASRTATGATSPLTVTGLSNGTQYSCSVIASNRIGSSAASSAVTATPISAVASAEFPGNIVLGAPTADSMRLKLYSADQAGSVIVSYRAETDTGDKQTTPATLNRASVLDVELSGLKAGAAYRYRVLLKPTVGNEIQSREYRFQTARAPGGTFTFTIQADSHLDENSDLDIYKRTLANVLADQGDFHVDLGDTFMTEKHAEPFTAVVAQPTSKATLDTRYIYERANFGAVTHSVPLFLVNGNHDAELGWLVDGSTQNIAIWASKARLEYFPIPQPGKFYSGDSFVDPNVGNRVAWYAWNWGDAQIIVLDPFWNTKQRGNSDPWNFTLGEKQYQWLTETLAASTAKFKIVFIHNLVGGFDGAMRGGIEAVPFYEWGGKNLDGTNGFVTRRPGWALPIHDLLVKYKVAAVFHGHDHLYAKQDLGGIVYQTVPQPSARNFNNGAQLAKDYRYESGTILSSSGHMRITITPTTMTARYVRSWLPKDETAVRKNGQIEHEWSITR